MQGTTKNKRFLRVYCKFYVKRNWQTLLFAILYILGLSMGVCFLSLTDSSQETQETLETLDLVGQVSEAFLSSRIRGNFQEIFFSSFLSIFWYIGLFSLVGLIRGGKWLVLPLIWFRGLGNGLSAAGIYYQAGWDAFPFMAAVVTPVALCQTVLLIWAANTVWRYQHQYQHHSAALTGEKTQRESRTYWFLFLLFTALSAVFAGLDALLSAWWM